MILNVSGRTDIVAFYSQWFINRLESGFVDVRNPFNNRLVSRINFNDVDAIMFCTKNPKPILSYLPKIKKPIIFHVTLTPYQKDIEPNVPNILDVIESIKKLSKIIGIDNLYVRYDPIFISEKYNLNYHLRAFNKICLLLNGHVNKIIVSFLDVYKNVIKNEKILKFKSFTAEDYKIIGTEFSKIAVKNNMTVQTCFEKESLTEYGFIKGECFSKEMAYKLTGKKYLEWKARKGGLCHCVEMVDIGAYNTCNHGCKYCYANFDEKEVKNNMKKHNQSSSLLIGELENDDEIKIMKAKSTLINEKKFEQISLLEKI